LYLLPLVTFSAYFSFTKCLRRAVSGKRGAWKPASLNISHPCGQGSQTPLIFPHMHIFVPKGVLKQCTGTLSGFLVWNNTCFPGLIEWMIMLFRASRDATK
jgi:hypothetical protein